MKRGNLAQTLKRYSKGWVSISKDYKRVLASGKTMESVLKQLKRIAELYLYENEIKEILCRFDVIAILILPGQKPQIEHFVNAFD